MTRAERIDENVAILGSSMILVAVVTIFLLDDRSGPLLQSLWMGLGGLAVSFWLWALTDLVRMATSRGKSGAVSTVQQG